MSPGEPFRPVLSPELTPRTRRVATQVRAGRHPVEVDPAQRCVHAYSPPLTAMSYYAVDPAALDPAAVYPARRRPRLRRTRTVLVETDRPEGQR